MTWRGPDRKGPAGEEVYAHSLCKGNSPLLLSKESRSLFNIYGKSSTEPWFFHSIIHSQIHSCIH